MSDNVILVDKLDNEIGQCEKLDAHEQGLLHRAISVFIFRRTADGVELLLQQRNPEKYHSGGLWTNTCCSHPYPGENNLAAAKRRLKEEMGFEAPLQYAGSFLYQANFANGLIENEFDHVYMGFYSSQLIHPDPREVVKHKWMDLNKLTTDLARNPQKYTAWLAPALVVVRNKV